MADKLLNLVVKNREGVQYDGQVRAVTSYNTKGQFDVLPMHTNFITILKKKMVIHKADGSKQEIGVDNGVMKVLADKIEVYLGIK
jgi:F0F1-type ATP synthase epsilon subunit